MMPRRVRLLRAHAARSRPGRRGGRAALLLLLVAGLALVGPMAARPAAAQCAPPAVTLSASPRAALAGQPVTFSFSATAGGPVVAGVSCGAPPLPFMLIDFGDGTSPLPLNGPSGTIGHAYAAPGTYAVVVTATSAGVTGQATATVFVSGGSQPSVVALDAAPQAATPGQVVDFTGRVVSAPPGAITVGATIDFGDGQSALPLTTGAGFIAQHVYAAPGAYTATLTVRDTTGRASQARATVVVGSSAPLVPQSTLSLSASPPSALIGRPVSFTGQVVAAPPGAVTTGATIDFGDGQSAIPQTTGAGFIAQHVYGSAGIYLVVLSVTDSTGATSRVQTTVGVSNPTVSWP
jgi:PKD repeat protein